MNVEVEKLVAELQASETLSVLYRPHPTSRKLIVAFGTGTEPGFVRSPFDHHVLSVADKKESYFLLDRGSFVKALVQLSEHFEGLVFFGGSKGGFGALLYAHECACRARSKDWRAVAFSPITLIGPNAPSEFYPSVRKLLIAARRNPVLTRLIETCGDLSVIAADRNLFATIVYPIGNARDAEAAVRLSAPNVRLFPLHFAIHNTFLPFGMRRMSHKRIVARLEQVYGAADDDIAATAPQDFEQLAWDIRRMVWLPTLNELLDATFGTRTNRVPDRPALHAAASSGGASIQAEAP